MHNNGVIFCPKRSGSTFLQEALNSHPTIICHDEMFMQNKKIDKRRGQYLYKSMKRDKGWNVEQYLDWLYNEDSNRSTLFRLIYSHNNKYGVLSKIMDKDVPVIHLIRSDVFRKEISRMTKGLELGQKIRLNKDTTISQMRGEIGIIESNRESLKVYNNKIEIDYDDLFGEVEGEQEEVKNYGAFNILSDQITYLNKDTGKKICDLLNIEYQPMWSNVSKRNPWNISEIISNYGKVKKAISKTEFSKLLED